MSPVSPRQQLTIGMPEAAAGGHSQAIDPGQQTLHQLLGGDPTWIEANHAGAHQSGMQNRPAIPDQSPTIFQPC